MKKRFSEIKLGLLLSAREKALKSFKSWLFSIKNWDKISTREPTPETAVKPESTTEPEVGIEATKVAKEKSKPIIA